MTDAVRKEFEQFWAETVGKVQAYMFCACANWADADDLSQECYLRALRGWGQFNGKGSRQAWLFAIARRTCADWFRQKRKGRTVIDIDNVSEPRDVSEKSDAEQVEAVWGAIKELKAEQSEVVHLRFAAGLNYAEIAQALGVPVGTVRSRLHRSLKAIREKIGEQEDET